MKVHLLSTILLLSAVTSLAIAVQSEYAPPPVVPPEEAQLKAIDTRIDKLKVELGKMRAKNIGDPIYGEVEIFLKAAQSIRTNNEFYTKDAGEQTLAVLDHGLLRASQALRGDAPWQIQRGYSVARAYRSRIDSSLQPYAITFPTDFGKDTKKKWRVDVVLHGRNSGLTEVSFLHQHDDTRAAPKNLGYVQIDIYGRGNNAYRWAGESDVYEVLDSFLNFEKYLKRDELLDLNRVVLRGFSMGGAGSWHLGLHQPDRWAVVGPGAGFTTTKSYVGKFPEPLTPTQEATLHLYDAVDYAENIFNVPVVAYAGADDKQLQAARNVEEAIKKSGLKVPLTVLVAPGLQHQFPAEWQKKAEAEYEKYLADGRPSYPAQVHFVTYTLKYPTCYWVEILGLDKHYERTVVDAKYSPQGYEVKTTNVRLLDLGLPATVGMERGQLLTAMTVSIDGQDLDVKPAPMGQGYHIFLEKRGGHWTYLLPERFSNDQQRVLQKKPGLQGPIDDAFMSGFLLVKGTGRPWHDATQRYADANVKRFAAEWSKYMRGDLQIKLDKDVTPEDMAAHNLILFGDPASNSLIEQVITGLPFKWNKDKITWADKEYDAADHVPVLIYPSPLNAKRYVVLNSGHTFHAADFEGTNALLYPRLGDHALLKLTGAMKDPLAMEVVQSGLFDEFWRMPVKP